MIDIQNEVWKCQKMNILSLESREIIPLLTLNYWGNM